MALTLAVTSCGDDPETPGTTPPSVASGTVVLYTSMPDSIVERLKGVFEGAFPDIEGNLWIAPGDAEAGGITLDIVRGRTADIEALITEDLASGGIRADVIWLAEPSPYEVYKDDELLAPYSPPPGTPIPVTFIDPDGYFVAGRVINVVLAWNTERRPAGLTDWPQLLEAEDAAFPGPQSGAARAAIEALTNTFGNDFFKRYAGAGGTAVASNGDARDGLVLGTYDAAGVLDYMIRQAADQGEPVDFAHPESGTVVIPSPIAITTNASNPEAAKVFVDFVLSRQGQQIVVEIGSFYPVRTDVAPPAGATPLEAIIAIPIDWDHLSDETESITEMWTELFAR